MKWKRFEYDFENLKDKNEMARLVEQFDEKGKMQVN